jgi:hypothetical protein
VVRPHRHAGLAAALAGQLRQQPDPRRPGRGPGHGRLDRLTECTPGYYNSEGQGAGNGAFFSVGHPEGAMAFFEYIDKWRAAGAFEGLEYR